jgi:flagellar basal body-associated protein FliL
MNTWNRIEELMDFVRTHDVKELKDYWNKRDEEKRNNTLLWVFAIIGAVAAVAAIAYAVYRYFTPDYLEDFEDDFDDDFEDDFFEDEEDDEEKKSEQSPAANQENAADEDDFAE